MTALDVTSQEAIQAVDTSVRWLNMMVNQIKPFTIEKINSVTKLGSGNYSSNVALVTEAFQGRNFLFDLELDPKVEDPTALVAHKQLN
jgi:hypothetical protein